ncbi:IS4 family transposase [Streptomyces mirabilis]|uniref:IS4 family transposase n=1 Tax=Streptomyces TaxID=1883 RepID=UPI00211C318B|nr:IS4 family transposase [Streptomyces sp. OK228]
MGDTGAGRRGTGGGCGVRDKKPGALPAGFMVYFALALALFQQDSYDDVAEQLVGGVPELSASIPNKSSFTRARRRLGPQVLESLFRELAGPLASVGPEGSFYRGMRLAAVDGFVLDAPDTKANRAAFGGPTKNSWPAGFPQVRVVTLTECGTHAQIDAAVGGFSGGEPELAIKTADSAAGMLVIMDRGFPRVALWKAYTGAGAHLLVRARSSVAARPVEHLPDGTYLARMSLAGQRASHPGGVPVRVIEYRVDGGEVVRLLTDLLDPTAYPAMELARLYHARWEAESAFRQIKTFQRGPAQVLRSADPETGAAGGLGAPGRAPLPHAGHHVLGRGQRYRSRQGLVRQSAQAHPAQRGPSVRGHTQEDQEVPGRTGSEGAPQARQRHQAHA